MGRAGLLALCVVVAGCDAEALTLVVDLKTDLVPGAEFVAVRTLIDGQPVNERPVAVGEDYLAGVRVAEQGGLAPGARTVRVSLVDGAGVVVVSRRVRVQQERSYALTILVTRDCKDVVCPGAGDPEDATECVAGQCTELGCSELDRATCPSAECSADGDCPATDPCAEATCEEGVCLARPRAGACGADEFCVPETGCETLPGRDAGAPPTDGGFDAGTDAGADAGLDGGVDAGFDAGVPSFLATALGAGGMHTCATEASTGALHCWGENTSRQLGLPGPEARLAPTPAGLGVASRVVAYFTHTCASDSGGQVRCWGRGAQRELGVDIGPDLFSEAARAVGALPVGSELMGGFQSCARVPAGGLRCWGPNAFGQLGIGSTTPSGGVLPSDVLLPGAVSDASVGSEHACAVVEPGDVYCWGRNGNHQLGLGAPGDRATPERVGLPTDADWRVGVGAEHSCAVDGSGELWCWGNNLDGQLGFDSPAVAMTPQRALGIAGVEAVCAGEHFTCALAAGVVSCAGANGRGELGRGVSGAGDSTFTPALGVTDADTLRCGKHHVCVRLTSRELRCWGEGSAGQLGDGLGVTSPTPVVVLPP